MVKAFLLILLSLSQIISLKFKIINKVLFNFKRASITEKAVSKKTASLFNKNRYIF